MSSSAVTGPIRPRPTVGVNPDRHRPPAAGVDGRVPVVPPSRFPTVAARDLTGRRLTLPDGLEGDRNVVVVAFRRHQQSDVDSWVPWLEERAERDPDLRFYEVPAISDAWAPARRFIDGGMATAIGDPVVLRRTLTVYGDLRRLTDPLEIDDRDHIHLFLVDGDGLVRWRAAGAFEARVADDLGAELDGSAERGSPPETEAPAPADQGSVQFGFAFDPRFRVPLALAGVTPGHAHVTVTTTRLLARFGPWSVDTPLDNVAGVCVTGPYRWYRAIGPRGSFADRGATFGSTTEGGVCVRFHDPVPGLEPVGLVRHPGLTMTVDDPDAMAALLRRRCTRLDDRA
jgi:hypothetical protein